MEDRHTITAFGELDMYIAFSFSSYSHCVCSAQSLGMLDPWCVKQFHNCTHRGSNMSTDTINPLTLLVSFYPTIVTLSVGVRVASNLDSTALAALAFESTRKLHRPNIPVKCPCFIFLSLLQCSSESA